MAITEVRSEQIASGSSYVRRDLKRHKWCAVLRFKDGDKWRSIQTDTNVPCYGSSGDQNRRGKRDAENFLRTWKAQVIRELELAEYVKSQSCADTTLYDYCQRFLEHHQVRDTTRRGYEACLADLAAHPIGQLLLLEVTGKDVIAWIEFLRETKGKSETSLAHSHAFLSMVLLHAVDVGDLKRSPILRKSAPKATPKPVNSLDKKQRKQVLQTLSTYENRQLAMAGIIALMTGMRRGEVSALRWMDIDFADDVIRVNHTCISNRTHGWELGSPKATRGGRSVRVIPLGNVLRKRLKAHKAWLKAQLESRRIAFGPEIYVCANPKTGARYNPDIISRNWSSLSQAMCWRGTQGECVSFHDLRHTFATVALAKGIDVMVVSSILGHKSPSMTLDVYATALPKSKKAAMNKLDEGL